jgi:endonuclease YncB( thermonuclease family)
MPAAALLACLVIGVADGDTLTARCETPAGAENIKVRLAEIDAPEKGQPWAIRSKRHLAQLCIKKTAELRPVAQDRYGRTVAHVQCNGVDANTEQVRAGMAWVFDHHVEDWTLFGVQRDARAAKAGLWADAAPVPPWEWRRGKKLPVSASIS